MFFFVCVKETGRAKIYLGECRFKFARPDGECFEIYPVYEHILRWPETFSFRNGLSFGSGKEKCLNLKKTLFICYLVPSVDLMINSGYDEILSE